jgi:hypothetical protein
MKIAINNISERNLIISCTNFIRRNKIIYHMVQLKQSIFMEQ